jgi:hypothetical protein
MTLVGRLRKDAALKSLPEPQPAGKRGRKPKYGKEVISLSKRAGQGQVCQAPKPLQPIDRGLPGRGPLAQIIADKYLDHLPLNRTEKRLVRLFVGSDNGGRITVLWEREEMKLGKFT